MISNISVEVDIASLQVYRSGSVIGSICANANGSRFPSSVWTDLVFAIIRNWLRETNDLALHKKLDADLVFFDGPYEIKLKYVDKNLYNFAFIESRLSKEIVVFSGQAELGDFIDSLNSAAMHLIDWANANNIINTDISEIINHFKQES